MYGVKKGGHSCVIICTVVVEDKLDPLFAGRIVRTIVNLEAAVGSVHMFLVKVIEG